MEESVNLCMNCMTYNLEPKGKCKNCGTGEQEIWAAPHHLKPRTVLNNNYIIGKVLGEGGFGITYMGWDSRLSVKVAIKEYYPNGFVMRDASHDSTVHSYSSGERHDFYEQGRKRFVDEARRLAKFFGLPGVVSVKDFFDENGTAYIVMEFIEGASMKVVLEQMGGNMPEAAALEMMKPLIKSLGTMHNSGVIHRDIAPDNIMIQHDGSVKLIDFGAAREVETDAKSSVAIMKQGYAPEEQYDSKRLRQGPWTDVYALCATIYRAIEGEAPPDSIDRLRGEQLKDFTVPVSDNTREAVMKGLEMKAEDRWQNVDELAYKLYGETDSSGTSAPKLVKYKPQKQKSRNQLRNAIIAVSSFVGVLALAVVFVIIFNMPAVPVGPSGVNSNGEDNIETTTKTAETEENPPENFDLSIYPQYIMLTVQQKSDFTLTKINSNGDVVTINTQNLTWSSEDENIASIENSQIVGKNLGETSITGMYENAIIKLPVRVVAPMSGDVDIVQYYELGHKVSLFGGSIEEREHIDGLLDGEAEFVSPESMDITDDGIIYIADSGVLRKIKNNTVESIETEPFYMTPKIIRCYKNEVYILTDYWEEINGDYYYGIVKLSSDDGTLEKIYITDAVYSAIEDFGFSPDNNLLYFIERNEGMETVYLKTINLQDTEDIRIITTLEKGTVSLAFGDDGIIYFANRETGVIQFYKDYLTNFSGFTNEKAFIDGPSPRYFMPQRIKYAGNALYVWDFNVLRKIIIDTENGAAVGCITLAGEASPEFDLENIKKEYKAEDVILAHGEYVDFLVNGDSVLLTDMKRGLIWEIK